MGRSTLAAIGALTLAMGASGFFTPSSSLRLALKHANGASCVSASANHDISMLSDADRIGQEEGQARQLTRQGWLQVGVRGEHVKNGSCMAVLHCIIVALLSST